MLFVMVLGGGAAALAGAQTEPDAAIRRVVVLAPPRASLPTPQVQWRIEQERATRRKPRRKSGRRSPATSGLPAAASNVPGSAGKDNRAAKPEVNSAQSTGAGPLKSAALPSSSPAHNSVKTDVVPPDQRMALAQALFADTLMERLQERLGLVVVGENELAEALQALHLTPEQATHPNNARRLCIRLNCQAALIPRVVACPILEGATRDAAVFTEIGITLSNDVPNDVPNDVLLSARWPGQINVAGTASADRVLLHSGYKKPQGDCIRDAAQQAANLLIHTLRTGQQAPFMRAEDRIAVTPVVTPKGADKLIFTAAGRRVTPALLGDLHAAVSAVFLPDFLPIAPDRVVGEKDTAAALAAQGLPAAALWSGEDQPVFNRVQTLGRSLRVEYVLLSHITDVELSESDGATDATANASPAEQERAVRVEAAAALVRVADGALLWRDRVTATMTAPLPKFLVSGKSPSAQSLARNATHFALVELQRRLRAYRSSFEK